MMKKKELTAKFSASEGSAPTAGGHHNVCVISVHVGRALQSDRLDEV